MTHGYYILFSLLVGASLALPPVADESCSAFHVDSAQCLPYWSLKGEAAKPPLLLVSLDGFRSDYLERLSRTSSTKGLVRLARCGVKAASMIPVFPTITLPNHYSIVTGLYPESHGIVAHEFYDPELGRNFSLPAAGFNFSAPNLLDRAWWLGEPVWFTIRRQGKKSASYFWPGSYINDPIRAPDYWLPYNGSIPFEQRISHVIDWLLLPQPKRPNFIGLYLEEPDGSGHNNGPDSKMVDEQILKVDNQIEFLIDSMAAKGILGCVDIIVVSDHGMASVPMNRNVVKLEEMVKDVASSAFCYDCAEGLTPTLRPINDSKMERDRIAADIECRNDKIRVYDKWDFPRRHHYANSPRISSLLFDLSISWRVIVGTEDYLPGGHGWDNTYTDMQAIFVAQGPSFLRDGSTVDPFSNVELYNLMCWLTGVDPAPNDGTWGALHHLLAIQPPNPTENNNVVPHILDYPLDNQGLRTQFIDHQKRRRVCDLLSGYSDPIQNARLNLTESAAKELVELHAPWGLPGSKREGVKVLISPDYIVGFNVREGIPSWVSYTLSNTTELSNYSVVSSWGVDPRLRVQDVSICDRFQEHSQPSSLLLAPLFFPNFCSSTENSVDGWVETNAIEISPAFEKYWQDIEKRIMELSGNAGRIHVVAGPARNSPSPAIFLVVSYCTDLMELDCSGKELDVQSFLLPTHLHYGRDCLSSNLFLRSHLATVRDVEHASGLNIFQSLSREAKVQVLGRTVLASSLLVDPRPKLWPNDKLASGHADSHKDLFSLRWIFSLLSLITVAVGNHVIAAI